MQLADSRDRLHLLARLLHHARQSTTGEPELGDGGVVIAGAAVTAYAKRGASGREALGYKGSYTGSSVSEVEMYKGSSVSEVEIYKGNIKGVQLITYLELP